MTTKRKVTRSLIKKLEIRSNQYDVWDKEVPGFGIRVSPGGAKSFIFMGRVDGKVKRVTIGKVPCDAHLSDRSIDEARAEAFEKKRAFRAGIFTPEPPNGTLGELLTAYADELLARGAVSASKVLKECATGVKKPHPELWNKPAVEITLQDCMCIVSDINERGTPRQADKVRGYLKAAYNRAINSQADVAAPKVMRNMLINSNPAQAIQKVDGSSNANDRVLSLREFRAYWKHVQKLEEPHRSVAMMHVLTGGQRMVQLARTKLEDIDRDSKTLRLEDRKGRRKKPRVFRIPLLPQALDCVETTTQDGPFIFSADLGRTPMSDQFVSDIAAKICDTMAEAGELEGSSFTGKIIRATIETRLMDKPYRVSSDVLKRLLSHGMGGIQEKHYAIDDFLDLQLEALEKLWRLLNDDPEPSAQIIPLRKSS